jgi:hypothetical protein
MIAVLTGDIVSSRQIPDKRKWLKRLKEIIEKRSDLTKPPKWGVFRGDGFQVELTSPADALRIAVLIRAGLKSVPELYDGGIDARIAIGIGEKGYTGNTVNESDGQAYQSSGAVLDSLKKERTQLQIKTPLSSFDSSMNIALQLASAIIDDWTQAEAEVVWLWLSGTLTQVEMAKKLKITQPAVHKRVLGAHLNEIKDLIGYFFGAVPVDSAKK